MQFYPNTPYSSPITSPADTAPVEDSTSIFYDSDPFRKTESPTELKPKRSKPALRVVTQRAARPPPPRRPLPATPKNTPQSPPPTTGQIRQTSIPWLRGFSKTKLLPSRKPSLKDKLTPDSFIRSAEPSPGDPEASSLEYSLPDLDFDQIDFSTVVDTSPADEEVSLPTVDLRITAPTPPDSPASVADSSAAQLSEATSPAVSQVPRLRLVLPNYTCVDPKILGVSPVLASAISRYSLAATPLPPSPSWLSRNVAQFEHSQHDKVPAAAPNSPSSPAPLPILPRSLRQAIPPSPAPLPILPRSLLPVSPPSPDPLPIPPPRARLPVITITTNFDTQVRYNLSSLLSDRSLIFDLRPTQTTIFC